ncbi:MAG: hypothetical protein WAR79_01060 [Melioribacteraceae bacterium]
MNKKFAAIDIGSNSFHLIIVEIFKDGHFEIIERKRDVLRLSEDFKNDEKVISQISQEKAIEILKEFSGIAKNYNAEIKAIATSSVRESFNKIYFIDKIFEETGIKIKIIDGIEEARLIYIGISNSIRLQNNKSLCIDIGGGSTEFIIGLNNKILFSASLKLGAVRLTHQFFPDYLITKSRINDCKKWIENELLPLKNKLKLNGINCIVGSSGTILSVGFLINSIKSKSKFQENLNNYNFTFEDLQNIEKIILNSEKIEDRIKITGLDEKRAEIIPAGIILLSTIFEQFKIEEIIISSFSLREGIIIDSLLC